MLAAWQVIISWLILYRSYKTKSMHKDSKLERYLIMRTINDIQSANRNPPRRHGIEPFN